MMPPLPRSKWLPHNTWRAAGFVARHVLHSWIGGDAQAEPLVAT
jgi:hypothetical protein